MCPLKILLFSLEYIQRLKLINTWGLFKTKLKRIIVWNKSGIKSAFNSSSARQTELRVAKNVSYDLYHCKCHTKILSVGDHHSKPSLRGVIGGLFPSSFWLHSVAFTDCFFYCVVSKWFLKGLYCKLIALYFHANSWIHKIRKI